MSDPMPGKPHDFVGRFAGLALDAQVQFMAELGRLDLAPARAVMALPREWPCLFVSTAAPRAPWLGVSP